MGTHLCSFLYMLYEAHWFWKWEGGLFCGSLTWHCSSSSHSQFRSDSCLIHTYFSDSPSLASANRLVPLQGSLQGGWSQVEKLRLKALLMWCIRVPQAVAYPSAPQYQPHCNSSQRFLCDNVAIFLRTKLSHNTVGSPDERGQLIFRESHCHDHSTQVSAVAKATIENDSHQLMAPGAIASSTEFSITNPCIFISFHTQGTTWNCTLVLELWSIFLNLGSYLTILPNLYQNFSLLSPQVFLLYKKQ